MKIVKSLSVCITLVLVIMSCQLNEEVEKGDSTILVNEQIYKDISVLEFQKLISENSIILDVRTADEYNAGHLADAVNIDFFSTNFMDDVLELNKSKTLLIHCASGGRSSKAMSKLTGKGFNTMYNMLGGFGAWKNNNLPSVK